MIVRVAHTIGAHVVQYLSREAEVDRGIEEFENKQVAMKKMVAKFDKFIQENDAKWKRAKHRAELEVAARKQCEEKIAEQEKELERAREDLDTKQLELDGLKRYQLYLEGITSTDGEFQDISEILNRHKTLTLAHEDLSQQKDENNGDIEGVRNTLQQMRQQQQNELLVMNSQVQQRQKELETLRAEVATADIDKESHDRQVKEKTMELGSVVLSIKNLYRRCLERRAAKSGGVKIAAMKEPASGDREAVEAYLTEALDLVQRTIFTLKYAEDGYPAYLASQARDKAEKEHKGRDKRANPELDAEKRRIMRGEKSTTSAKLSSDVSGAGFAAGGAGGADASRRRGGDDDSRQSFDEDASVASDVRGGDWRARRG